MAGITDKEIESNCYRIERNIIALQIFLLLVNLYQNYGLLEIVRKVINPIIEKK